MWATKSRFGTEVNVGILQLALLKFLIELSVMVFPFVDSEIWIQIGACPWLDSESDFKHRYLDGLVVAGVVRKHHWCHIHFPVQRRR